MLHRKVITCSQADTATVLAVWQTVRDAMFPR